MAANPGYAGSFFNPVSFTPKPATQTQTTPYGTFSSQNSGQSWTTPTGAKVGDLSGYLQMKQQQQAGANIQPYTNTLRNLVSNPSSITSDPYYQFLQQQGQQGLERSAAAKGMLNSGNTLAELLKYNQGLAGQAYNQRLNQLQGLQQGAEQFGLQSGYYQQPQNIAPYWSGGALISPKTQVSQW